MIRKDLLVGEKVRLVELDPERIGELWAKWRLDTEYIRMLDSDPAHIYSAKTSKEWMEKHLDDLLEFEFGIQSLEDGKLIGSTGLEGNIRTHGEAFVGIGIGEPAFRGKGYGTDAMRVILRFGFLELGLHRVSLNVFEYNQRAIRSYQKAGFSIEGVSKKALLRDGKRWDLVWMGILKEEWKGQNGY